MKYLNVQLSGGLGNQLFQYATARAISIKQGIPIAIDQISGFIRDKKYRRQCELTRLPISLLNPKLIAIASLWLYRGGVSIASKKEIPLVSHRWYGDFYFENKFIFHSLLLERKISRSTWLIGYYQSPLYFDNYKDILYKELMPLAPKNDIFLAMGDRIRESNSVALGLRLYEESDSPANHALAGRLKSTRDINRAIDLLSTQRPNSRFFIFCTHRAAIINELNLPKDSVYVTAEDGFVDSVDCLWLLTQCKHHIFTNSSFYWWGAWLSEAVHPNTEQLIYAADNFINADGLCDHWHRF